MKTATFRIEGMHCEGCARTIEALVGRVPGVKQVSVSFDAREARVRFGPGSVTHAAIVAAIERAGLRAEAAAQ